MSVFRVNKTNDYTVMSNQHLRDRRLSLKAKGLLSLMLSLPDDWDYSLPGLVSICKEEKTAIKSTLDELKEAGYVKITKLFPNQTESSKIEYVYDIFESTNQDIGFLALENLPLENQALEDNPQLNTKEVNTKKVNTKDISTPTKAQLKEASKKPYGKLNNVRLTDDELAKLKAEFKDWEWWIDTLSVYIASKGDKYKSHYATILNWYRRENGGKPNVEKEYF